MRHGSGMGRRGSEKDVHIRRRSSWKARDSRKGSACGSSEGARSWPTRRFLQNGHTLRVVTLCRARTALKAYDPQLQRASSPLVAPADCRNMPLSHAANLPGNRRRWLTSLIHVAPFCAAAGELKVASVRIAVIGGAQHEQQASVACYRQVQMGERGAFPPPSDIHLCSQLEGVAQTVAAASRGIVRALRRPTSHLVHR